MGSMRMTAPVSEALIICVLEYHLTETSGCQRGSSVDTKITTMHRHRKGIDDRAVVSLAMIRVQFEAC